MPNTDPFPLWRVTRYPVAVSIWILWSSAVLAAAPTARVGGVSGARAVAILVQRGSEVAGVGCDDAGNAGDAAPDGIHTCGPLPPVDGPVRVGLLRDGKLVDAGETTLGAAGLVVRVDGGVVVLGDDPAILPAARSGAPAPATTTLFARVRAGADGPAPVVRVQGPAGSAELWCRDDGVFPDAERNDGEHGCAGPAPGGRGDVYLNGGGDGSLGGVSWDPTAPFAFLVVDVAARTARAEAFELPGFAPRAEVVATPPAPEPVTPEAPTPPAPVPVEQPPPGVDPGPPPAPEAPGHSPVASRDVGGASPFALLAALALGVGGGWAWRRRAHRLPSTLRPHPAPALFPGGPALSDPACTLRCDAPEELAAALLPVLARHRRVVVVAAPGVALPAVADGPVYRAERTDCEEVEAAVRTLARVPGPPVAVLVVGDALSDAGAVVPAGARRLRDGLPAGVWLVVVAATPAEGLPAWEVEGPPWRVAGPRA